MRYEMRPHVDLCSGIGGFALGFIAAQVTEPVLFCDFDENVRKLLKVRFPGIPIANDVKEIASDPKRFIHERPFILSSGYPCQPFSASGKRRGEEDPRHIFPHIAEIVKQTRPSYCVFENVYGHISLGLDKVLSQMGSLDYTTATFVVPAAGFRPHKRDRLWIICKNMADPDNEGIWACERGSNIDYERLGGERRTNRGRGTSHDEWHDTQTTEDERMDVANSDNTANGTSESEAIKDKQTIKQRRKGIIWSEPSRLCTDVADTKGEGLQGWKLGTAIKSEEPRVSDTWTENSNGKTEDVANTKGFDRNDHELDGEHGEEKAQEILRNRDGISDTQRQVVGNSECELGETQLQRKQCLLREQNSERQTERLSDGDISEGGIRETFASFRRIFNGISGWLDEPRHIERTTHKNEHRNERLKQLGNALLPQITYRIGLAIKECEENK
jgi:site-specific DNA-cytosine methylase